MEAVCVKTLQDGKLAFRSARQQGFIDHYSRAVEIFRTTPIPAS
jgi:hypothetical protein